MPIPIHSSPAVIPTCSKVAEVVSHFLKHGVGAKAKLTATHKCTNERVRNYFYRQNCKVSVFAEDPGVRLITCNGFNTTGKAVKRARERKREASKRNPDEPTVSEVVGGKNLDVGDTLFVKGNEKQIRHYLSKKFGAGTVSMNQNGDGWNITRLR